MMKMIAFMAMLAVAIPNSHAVDDEAVKAAKKLEGTYEVLGGIRGGKPDENVKEVESIIVKHDKMVFVLKQGKEKTAKFTLDLSKKPTQIDIMPDNGGNETIKGIYEAKETDKGLELFIAFGRDRPKDFKGDGENEASMKLLRKKAK